MILFSSVIVADLVAERDGLVSSLGLKAPNGHSETLVPCVGKPLILGLDRVELHLFPMPCKRNSCPRCLIRNAKRRQAAIFETPIERMICFTHVAQEGDPNPCDTAKIGIKRMSQALRRKGIHLGEMTWTIEHNPGGTGYHAHALQHGPYVPQEQLQVACHKGNIGMPHINAIREDKKRAVDYGLKGFTPAAYSLKTFKNQNTAVQALKINNNKLEHHTRGFYLIDGKVRSVKDAEAIAHKKRKGEPDKNLLVGSPGELLQFVRLYGNKLGQMAA
jgi:hypothetical protein